MQFRLRLAHLYPTLMNLYGDRGNILCLRHRCEARQIALVVDEITLNEPFDPHAYDLIFIGGGQDREQQRVAADLLDKGEAIREAVEADVPALAVCGGYQFFGQYYQPAHGERLPGIGVFEMYTRHPGEAAERCIGNVVVEWEGQRLVGFENHGGRTYLHGRTEPLARIVAGFGNNGEDGTEGARYRNAFGTYLHGSLLPKNPVLADRLIGLALQHKYGEAIEVAPLDDTVEDLAREDAVAIALRDQVAARERLPRRIGRLAAWFAGRRGAVSPATRTDLRPARLPVRHGPR